MERRKSVSDIGSVPLKDISVFLSCSEAEPGNLLAIVREGVRTRGMRCALRAAGSFLVNGFVPFEGGDLGIFLNDTALGHTPALNITNLDHISLWNAAPTNSSLNDLKVGDVCVLQGFPHVCLAIGRVSKQTTVSSFLVLQGELAGQIVEGYHPQVRLGTIGIEPIKPTLAKTMFSGSSVK
jgi:hypothetical protein